MEAGAPKNVQQELAEVLRNLSSKLGGVTDMQDKDLDELLMEKLARTKRKKEVLAEMQEREGAIIAAVESRKEERSRQGTGIGDERAQTRPGEEDDEQLHKAEREMKEAGL